MPTPQPPAVVEFAAMVEDRRLGVTRDVKARSARLRALGWSVFAVSPKAEGGAR